MATVVSTMSGSSQPFSSASRWKARRYTSRADTATSPPDGAAKAYSLRSTASAGRRVSSTRRVGFQYAADGEIPVESVIELLVLKLVTYMDVLLPLMLYVSLIMVLGRWSRDNEMAVLAASGVGLRQFLRPVLVLGVTAAVLVGGFSLYLSPLGILTFPI